MRYGKAVSTAIAMALSAAFSSGPASAQAPCEWCFVQMTGTEITGYGCSTEEGLFQLDPCTATSSGCEGQICTPEEEELPDLMVIAVLSDCGSQTSKIATPRVVADVWRGVRLPVPEAVLNALPPSVRGASPLRATPKLRGAALLKAIPKF